MADIRRYPAEVGQSSDDDESEFIGDNCFVLDSIEEPDSNEDRSTSAAQARKGKDIQGIHWRDYQFTRSEYRETRLKQYRNYENLNVPRDQLEQEYLHTTKESNFFEFHYNTQHVRPTVVHFQLRNLVWATSKQDVYMVHNTSIWHWCPLTRKRTDVLNISHPLVPAPEVQRNRSVVQPINGHMQISTMCVRNNLLVLGGFDGELVCKFLDRPGVSFCNKTTYDENAITNSVEIYEKPSGATRLMTSNNDHFVRIFDVEKFSMNQKFNFPWPVNHTAVSPEDKLLIVVGDNPDGLLADLETGKVLATLKGHLDYSFASAWHPDGHIFVTGNQDTTCRVWDVRNLSASLAVLNGRMGAIRSLRFTSDGRFLAMAEPADFVHIFDVNQQFRCAQEIDFFGEIAGISFSPDAETLFIGVSDTTYGSLLEYKRCHASVYLDSM